MKCLREKGQGPRIDQYFLRSQSSQSNEIQRQEANHSSQDISTPVIDVRRTCMDTVSDEPNDPCEPVRDGERKTDFRPQLYDTSRLDYKDTLKKQDTWDTIAAKLDMSDRLKQGRAEPIRTNKEADSWIRGAVINETAELSPAFALPPPTSEHLL
ncbi:UNVERIFIED_CONTAM: hypothetical protein FKN15_059452 [Acipenser sinensis]